MKLQMNRGTGLLLFALAGCLPTTLGFAEPPHHLTEKPLERAGRLFGVCWGDGYHACASSGKRLLADLPPKSHLVRPVMHYKSVGSRNGHHHHGPTFYDRFDALNQSLFHTTECCIPGCEIVDCDGQCRRSGCDNIGCDSPGCDGTCDGAGYATERGVMMTPGGRSMSMPSREPSAPVDLPSFSGPPQPEFAAPTQNEGGKEESEPLPEPKQAPSVKPSKPADEASKEGGSARLDAPLILTAPRAAADLPRQIPVAGQPFETPPVSPLTNRFRDRPDSLARRSPTPSKILPEFPSESESSSRKSTGLQMPTFARSAERPARLGQLAKPVEPMTSPKHEVIKPLARGTGPVSQESRQSSPLMERPTVTTPITIGTKPQRLGQRETDLIAADSSGADNQAISPKAVSPSNEVPAATKAVARTDRPTRLGASSATPRPNPFAARPVVEMAKRASESDEGVVRQPSQLK